MTKETFPDWIRDRLREYEINQAELSRRSRVSEAQITRVLQGATAGYSFCTRIAMGFNLPPEVVLQEAGLISPTRAKRSRLARINHLASQLENDDDLDDIEEYIRMKLDRRRKKFPQEKSKPKRDKAGENSALLIKSES